MTISILNETSTNLFETMNHKTIFENVRTASHTLFALDEAQINIVLNAVADEADLQQTKILSANAIDLAKMEPTNPKYDRLKLTNQRLLGITTDLRNVALLPSPIGKVMHSEIRPNGMKLTKISVPFGVIGVIYEARPNVTFDLFSLCFKSGNACILKGGHDADATNNAIVAIIKEVLQRYHLNPFIIELLPADRAATDELLHAKEYVDLIIPRGSSGLINYVRENATVPVIETGAGICHTYFHKEGDVQKGADIVNNAKTRRPSVCNSLDCLIIDHERLADLIKIVAPLAMSHVKLFADDAAYQILKDHYPDDMLKMATAESYGTEFLDYKMAIKTVESLEEALAHIEKYGSKHSECIITENKAIAQLFIKQVDAACVYVNVSTAFTDGAQFGLGAEVGISTQKMHARGPMGLQELTSYKWIIEGQGQIRER